MNIFRKIIIYYLPAILWAGLIFYLSSIAGLKVGAESFYWEVLFRKLAHVSEYMILSWLVWRIFYHCHGSSVPKSFLYPVFFVIFFAMGDELHQAFVQGRAGRTVDVAIDSLSAISLLSLFSFIKADSRKAKWFLLGCASMVAAIFTILFLSNQALLKQKSLDGEAIYSLGPDNVKNDQAMGTEEESSGGEAESNLFESSPDDNGNKIIQRDSRISDGQVSEINGAEQDSQKDNSTPQSILIKVPFTSQAPYANWDDVHEEACEEASLIMVKYYLTGENLTKESAEKEIQKMKDFQLDNFGTYKDSNMQQLAKLAEDFYGLKNLGVVYDFSKEEIKKQLSQGKVLILPTAGRKLGNPNFTSPGPLYHNLVAIGYDGDKIITNDPGTRNGEKYTYDIDVLYEAIHDFPGNKEDIEKGRRAMIIVSPG